MKRFEGAHSIQRRERNTVKLTPMMHDCAHVVESLRDYVKFTNKDELKDYDLIDQINSLYRTCSWLYRNKGIGQKES